MHDLLVTSGYTLRDVRPGVCLSVCLSVSPCLRFALSLVDVLLRMSVVVRSCCANHCDRSWRYRSEFDFRRR